MQQLAAALGIESLKMPLDLGFQLRADLYAVQQFEQRVLVVWVPLFQNPDP